MNDRKGALNLAFVGDVCLGLNMAETINQFGGEWLFKSISPYFDQADIRVGNLESCLIDSTCSESARKQMMAVSRDTANVLDWARFNVLNIANNHMLDCGPESVKCTRRFLEDKEIVFSGAGPNIEEASKIAYIRSCGKVVAFIGFGDTTRYFANHTKTGIAPMLRELMAKRVAEARRSSDLVIVSLHSDLEFAFYPSTWRVRLSRWLVDKGAHLVIQHHPHVVQGIEVYRHGLIAYSLGNFVFPTDGFEYMENRPGVKDSFILQVSAEFTKVEPELKWQIVPVGLDRFGRPQVLESEGAKRVKGLVDRLSTELADSRRLRQAWFARCREEAKYQATGLYWGLRDGGPKKAINRLIGVMRTPEHRRWMKGLCTLGWR